MDKPLTIEWVYPPFVKEQPETRLSELDIKRKRDIPVVCLAEVDALMAEAVWAMEHVIHTYRHVTDDRWIGTEALQEKQRAQAFLARPDVAAWRERQKKEGANDD